MDALDAVNVARLIENDNPFISQHVLQHEIATHLKQKNHAMRGFFELNGILTALALLSAWRALQVQHLTPLEQKQERHLMVQQVPLEA